MEASPEKLRGAFWGGIVGDALATPLSGLGKGHIGSVFRGGLTGYTDPEPALKGKETSWKKPGLYTAPSQLALLLSFTEGKARRGDIDPVPRVAAAAQQGGTCGIFRHPDALLLDLIGRCRTREEGNEQQRDPRIDLLPPLQVFLHLLTGRMHGGHPLTHDTLAFARFITVDYHAIAASAILVSILDAIFATGESSAAIELAIDCARDTLGFIRGNPATIFDLKINPETLADRAAHVAASIELLRKAKSAAEAEPLICEHARRFLQHNITRATVNHALTLAPCALAHFVFHADDPGSGFFAAASGGGAAGTLTSTAGTLLGALRGEDSIPETLREGLVNKTRIGGFIGAISSGRTGAGTMQEFLDSESALTRKEEEELRARTRHVKVKEKKVKSGSDRERELNRHVVESWTKLDKAKWKKRDKDRYSE